MQILFAIAVGGAAGALMRHFFNEAVTGWAGANLPWGIFAINVLGSALMGVLTGLFAHGLDVPPPVRALLTVGLLGGFTTFSAFSLDTVTLIERGQAGLALLYAGGSVALSVAALYGGLVLARSLTA